MQRKVTNLGANDAHIQHRSGSDDVDAPEILAGLVWPQVAVNDFVPGSFQSRHVLIVIFVGVVVRGGQVGDDTGTPVFGVYLL